MLYSVMMLNGASPACRKDRPQLLHRVHPAGNPKIYTFFHKKERKGVQIQVIDFFGRSLFTHCITNVNSLKVYPHKWNGLCSATLECYL